MNIPIRTEEPAMEVATDQRSAVDHRKPRVRNRSHRNVQASPVAAFLQSALAGGAVPVAELEEKARAAELIGERQTITDSKKFKAAKAALQIRSYRVGFGRGAVWFWALPTQSSSPMAESLGHPPPDAPVSASMMVTVPGPVSALPPSRRPVPIRIARPTTAHQCGESRLIGSEASRSFNHDHGHQVSLNIDGVYSLTIVFGSLLARGLSAPPNWAGTVPAYSAAVSSVPTSTLEARDCSGIWPAARSCGFTGTAPRSGPRMKRAAFKGGPVGQPRGCHGIRAEP
jgi:hypothetical protein